MITWGMVGNSHDASIAVFDGTELTWASLSKDFSGIPNDPDPNWSQIKVAREFTDRDIPDEVVWLSLIHI